MLLEVQNIRKSFQQEAVLQQISFSLEKNTILSILGKSGCGKTTLLKTMAGLLSTDSGEIWLQQQSVLDQPAHLRNMVYLNQESLLFPHLSVYDNIAFGLQIRKLPPQEIKHKTLQLLEQLNLSAHADKKPHQLSGGQKQRVNFGRAIIINPTVLLLDEPFGNLDTQTRSEMQQLFLQLTKQYQITAVFVTHDLKEALLVGDQMALLTEGILKTYPDKKSFINDEVTGVLREQQFWQSL